MQELVQITFRDFPHSDSIEEVIRKKAAKLNQVYDRITRCKVVIEAPHRNHSKGKLYEVHIRLTLPRGELAVSRSSEKKRAHEDPYVAIRDAFAAARRQLGNYVKRQRDDVRTPAVPAIELE